MRTTLMPCIKRKILSAFPFASDVSVFLDRSLPYKTGVGSRSKVYPMIYQLHTVYFYILGDKMKFRSKKSGSQHKESADEEAKQSKWGME